jgi:hypothetical protein
LELAVDAQLADDCEEELVVVFFLSGHFDDCGSLVDVVDVL